MTAAPRAGPAETGVRRRDGPPPSAKLGLGPVLFHWPPERKRDFYFQIADEAPIDIVYVGEVACSKRAPFFDPFLPEIVERLQRAGKEVVHSTLALVMNERERQALAALAADPGFEIEANDVAALALCQGRPHVVGPFVNVYNEATLAYLARNGARRVVLSCELPETALACLAAESARQEGRESPELEVQVFGRLPLALSARCYHARAHGLAKDSCRYVCSEDGDGMAIATVDGEPFLAVNGTMTMTHTVHCLIGGLDRLRAMGMASFRIWPHDIDMVSVANLFRGALDGALEPARAEAELALLVPFARFANGYFHGREGAAWLPAAAGC